MNFDETVVRSTCPTCGTVDMPADAVTVLVTAGAGDPVYRYCCPQCLATVQKPTSAKAVGLLRGAGARLVVVPAEVTEWYALTGPVLDEEDAADFAGALATVDDLARLALAPSVRRPTVR